jgi:hypothetical protein
MSHLYWHRGATLHERGKLKKTNVSISNIFLMAPPLGRNELPVAP